MAVILLTGGSGRLGQELQQQLELVAPSSSDFDITSLKSIEFTVKKHQPDLIIHAAAYTDVAGAEKNRTDCWQVNVEGTKHLVSAARSTNTKLIFISTDYVFWGEDGLYKESDTPGPVRNYYALTKLLAEQIVQTLDNYLIIRTSFRAREWTYPVAFADLFTSQDYIDVIAPELVLALKNHSKINEKILHIGTERKSVHDLACRRNPKVQKGTKASAQVELPNDVSLDSSLWQTIKAELA